MNKTDVARHTTVGISFNGTDITNDIKPYFLSLSYTDCEEGETDDLQIKLQDRDGIWIEKWLNDAIGSVSYTPASPTKTQIAKPSENYDPETPPEYIYNRKLELHNAKAYISPDSEEPFCTISGTYYYWHYSIINGKIRITDSESKTDLAGGALFWISTEDFGNGLTYKTFLENDPSLNYDSQNKTSKVTGNNQLSGSYVSIAEYKKLGNIGEEINANEMKVKGIYAEPKTGMKLFLNRVPLFESSTSTKPYIKSGYYYIWDAAIVNGRMRITNLMENVGKPGQVTGWVDKGYIERSLVDTGIEVKNDIDHSGHLFISAYICRHNWLGNGKEDVIHCGEFELDDITASGPPAIISLKASSLSFTTTIRQTKKTKAWEKYKLSGIAEEMAQQNGMKCMFLSSYNPSYDRVEQFNMSDISFLSKLCTSAGISLKATSNMIVLFDQSEYENGNVVMKVNRGDGSYAKYKLSAGKADKQYTSCRVCYTTPSGQLIEAIAKTEDYAEKSGNSQQQVVPNVKEPNEADTTEQQSEQQLVIHAKVSSIAEAQTLAEKLLRYYNKFERSLSFTFPGNHTLVAGVCIEVGNWGAFNGKYIIKKAVHKVDNNGYTTQIELRKVLEGY